MPSMIDMTGWRVGRLVVLRQTARNGRRIQWLCRCDCGNEITAQAGHLQAHHTKSCGCLSRETTTARNNVHGSAVRGHKTRTYKAWAAMKQRCYQPSHVAYDRYGGAGIAVCDQWRDDYLQFLADMGPCPDGLTLDRYDSTGNYTPENCRWASYYEQGNNTRRNVQLTMNGRTMNACQWAKETGINYGTLVWRVGCGWDHVSALTIPVGLGKRPHLRSPTRAVPRADPV